MKEWQKIIKKEELGEPYKTLAEIFDLEDILKIAEFAKGKPIYFNREAKAESIPEITAAVGVEKAEKAAKLFLGELIYFPDIKKGLSDKFKEAIRKEFNGYNARELALKYEYSLKFIQETVKGEARPSERCVEGQMSLFDEVTTDEKKR
jgi:Mor family transcriptional regulator